MIFSHQLDRQALIEASMAGPDKAECSTCAVPSRAAELQSRQAVRTIARRNPICRWIFVGGLVRVGEWIFRQIGS
jgi:hypothetical protein